VDHQGGQLAGKGGVQAVHHLPAQICIAALPLAPQTSKWERRIVSGILTAYLICLVVLDLPGYQALWQYICK
jgi:hypothetical protein